MLALLAFIGLGGWFYLAFFHGRFWQPLVLKPLPALHDWPAIDIIIPARDEALSLPHSLPSILAQDYPGPWRVILIDDHSRDGTADVALRVGANAPHLHVLTAPAKPAGWTGKVAAMQAGLAHSDAPYVLFTDADIRHPPDALRRLAARAMGRRLDLVSLMVRLHCRSTAEKLLIPAFVFFFAMLYPFRSTNDAHAKTAAAAGGVMLVRREALDKAGGLERIRHALIDDCALAHLLKYPHGGRLPTGFIELSLATDTVSLRSYPQLIDIWRMVARTAFTQLDYSPLLLAGTVLGMFLLFCLPLILFVAGSPLAGLIGLAAWAVMTVIYAPTIRFYHLPLVWAVTLPLAALLYIGATIDSARLYWQGMGGSWKGRNQA